MQGSLATTALLTAKPFSSIANVLAPITGYSINDNKIVLVHTRHYDTGSRQQTIEQITRLKKNTGNLLLLQAGQANGAMTAQLPYDAAMKPEECVSISTNNYKIIHKGDIKIGIITATAGQKATIKNINSLAARLKKERNCQVVICLSQLGYKNTTSIDDLKLAERSTHLDIIIGGHPDNFSPRPVIARNSERAEVIIHSDAGNGFAFGNIEIDFDGKRNKRSIAINDLTKRQQANA